jgi:hypothetical protein
MEDNNVNDLQRGALSDHGYRGPVVIIIISVVQRHNAAREGVMLTCSVVFFASLRLGVRFFFPNSLQLAKKSLAAGNNFLPETSCVWRDMAIASMDDGVEKSLHGIRSRDRRAILGPSRSHPC